MNRADLPNQPWLRIRLATSAYLSEHLVLTGNDDEGNVSRHDRADDGAHMDVRGTRAENVEEPPRGEHQEHVHSRAEQQRPPTQELAQCVVHGPSQHDGRDTDRDRSRRCESYHARIDEVGAGPDPIDYREQTHTGQPRRICFPFEPMQVEGQRLALWTGQVLLIVVEPPAMDGPQLAEHAAGRIAGFCRGPQMVIEPDEVERGPDPHHAGGKV